MLSRHGARGRLRLGLALTWAWAVPLAAAACSSPGSDSRVGGHVVEPLRETGKPRAGLTEPEKIDALLEAARHSGMTFLRNGRPYDGLEAARHLERKREQAGDRVKTARGFITTIATESSMTGKPYQVKLPDGRAMAAKAWFTEELGRIEAADAARQAALAQGVQGRTQAAEAAQGPDPREARTRSIPYVIRMIEQSDHEFVAPQRKGPPKVMAGPEFASMLRNKWQWLGRDINELEPFLDEIAGNAFSSMKPYRVRISEDEEVELRPWIERELGRYTAATNEQPGDGAAP